ncbi:TylF/MycF/NovP-related O-methyltransferase [Candidatus Binatus sp.]|uniref:TylF/MycF/NovP-related O-methyltransferase n=1 Tax=Candidatus Binatus sp. TaxID=2811406 RepID=UPI002F937420
MNGPEDTGGRDDTSLRISWGERLRTMKDLATRLGPILSKEMIHTLDASISYLEVGRWLKSQGLVIPRRVESRANVYDQLINAVRDKPVLYLEFGVWQGRSIRYWSERLRHPDSCLHGFDSFEGLPESWNMLYKKGLFSTNGQPPQIDDPRVKFFKGWFEDTLPNYRPPRHDQLVINIDADLYSSTRFVLNALKGYISIGTYIYFDEFCDRNNELRAFDEFLAETNMRFEVASASRSLMYIAFRRIG